MAVYEHERTNVAILVTGQTLFMVAAITVLTLSSVVGLRLSPDPGLATLPVSLMMVGTVITTLPASLFMKRVGRRLGFITGATIGGIGGGVLSFTAIAVESFWLFCAGNLLMGVYQGFSMYYRFAAADVASPALRSRAISWVMAGGVIAAFIGPWNASTPLNWIPAVPSGSPYLIIAGFAFITIVLLTFLRVPAASEPDPADQARPMSRIAARPAFTVALLSGAIGYAIMALVMTATPLAMHDVGFDMSHVSFIMLWHVLGMFAPSFFTGTLIARIGIRPVLFAGAALLTASAVIAPTGTTLVHFWLALTLLGIGWNFLFIGGSTLLARIHTPAERGKVQGVNDLAVFSLVACGSLLSGVLLHQLGWNLLNLAMLPLILLIALAVFRLRNEALQQEQA